MKTSIYEKYGGFDFFHDCIYELYVDMFDHPEISYHFLGVNINKLVIAQTHYLIRSIGGPDLYKGRSIKKVHRNMGITEFQFLEIACAFREVFLSKGMAPEDVEIIMKFIASHQKRVVTAKNSPIDNVMRPVYRFVRRYLGKYLSRENSWSRSGKIKEE